jgi:hypothetical protein
MYWGNLNNHLSKEDHDVEIRLLFFSVTVSGFRCRRTLHAGLFEKRTATDLTHIDFDAEAAQPEVKTRN